MLEMMKMFMVKENIRYTPEPNGNLQMEQMMGKLMNKLDNFDSPSQTGGKRSRY